MEGVLEAPSYDHPECTYCKASWQAFDRHALPRALVVRQQHETMGALADVADLSVGYSQQAVTFTVTPTTVRDKLTPRSNAPGGLKRAQLQRKWSGRWCQQGPQGTAGAKANQQSTARSRLANPHAPVPKFCSHLWLPTFEISYLLISMMSCQRVWQDILF